MLRVMNLSKIQKQWLPQIKREFLFLEVHHNHNLKSLLERQIRHSIVKLQELLQLKFGFVRCLVLVHPIFPHSQSSSMKMNTLFLRKFQLSKWMGDATSMLCGIRLLLISISILANPLFNRSAFSSTTPKKECPLELTSSRNIQLLLRAHPLKFREACQDLRNSWFLP